MSSQSSYTGKNKTLYLNSTLEFFLKICILFLPDLSNLPIVENSNMHFITTNLEFGPTIIHCVYNFVGRPRPLTAKFGLTIGDC